MKYLKYLLIIKLMFSFAMVSCKKDSTTAPVIEPIVGIWNVASAIGGWLLTTNSNQEAIDFFDTSGQINISGSHIGTMNFMAIDNDTDPPSFMVFDLLDGNLNYVLFLDGTTGEGMLIANVDSQTYNGNVTFTYDGTTLTITQSTIQNVANTTTVTISGSLSYYKTNIPANTPTLIPWPDFDDGGDGVGFSIIDFKSDGTATVTTGDPGGTDTESWTYTQDGNQVTVTDEDDEMMTFDITFDGTIMTWSSDVIEDPCDGSANQAECFAAWEEDFNLEEGSLTNIIITIEIVFQKAAAKQGLNVGRSYDLFNPSNVIKDYKLKIAKLKQNL